MRVLLVHPSPLMYSEIYLRLEPLGLERVAAAVRAAGHDVRLLDLQIFRHRDYARELEAFKPDAVGFSVNYLANVPEVIELAREARRRRPDALVFAGGHSVSFIAPEVLDHAAGALDCVVRGEGEGITPRLLEAHGDHRLETLPGAAAYASSITWRRAATCCCATASCPRTGSGSGCATCSSVSRPSTRTRSGRTVSASLRTTTCERSRWRARWT